jgi:hypothetical protein
VRALTLFAPVPAPEAVDAVVAALERTESRQLVNACMLFISEQRAAAAAHAAHAPALRALLRVAETSEEWQDRSLALIVLQELLEARRGAARRGAPPLPPHLETARLLAVCVSALRSDVYGTGEPMRIHLYSAAQQLVKQLMSTESVSNADARATGLLPALTAVVCSIRNVTDAHASAWSGIVVLLSALAGPDAMQPDDDEAALDAANDARNARADAVVDAGVHEAVRATAAAHPANASVQSAACLALCALVHSLCEHDIVRPGGLMETALVAQRCFPLPDDYCPEETDDAQAVATAAVQALAGCSPACRARMYELLGFSLAFNGRGGSFLPTITHTEPAMVLPPVAPRRDRRVAEAMTSALAAVPMSLQLHMARAAAAASLRRCIAQVKEADPSASAPPQRARRSEAFVACVAVLAVADGVDAGRRFEAAVKDEDGEDGEDDALLEAATAATIAAAGASGGAAELGRGGGAAEALAAWNAALVTLALLGQLAIVEESQGAA